MEMRAIEDTAIGQDLTPPLRPLAVVLHDSALSSYCSACFSTLPPQPFPPFAPAFPQNPYHVPIDTPTPLYCSPTAPPLAAYLLDKRGGKVIAKARRMCLDENVNVEKQDELVLEEMVLCLVLTNAVEVQDKSGCCIGVAVYETAFSWINHSCSPNACYRFLMGLEDNEELPALRITPAAKSGCGNGYDNGFIMEGDVEKNGYGPRIIVRSIKAVNKGEEVTIAYTNLLQPKEMRRAELWSKYRFSCSCKRCGAVPEAYVDNALQALSAANPESSDYKIEKLMQSFDNAITDYLSSGDPISCCKNLENLLTHGHLNNKSREPNEAKSPQKLKLHPFHYLSLNTYTALSSAYKVHASDLSVLNSDIERQKLEAFKMYKTSAAYSLLLAGVAHHLFTFESSLVTTVANFWINAGESMLNLSRSFFGLHF
ncbi:hypothetical protein DH2020_007965 [Rehmannia glutinosa]|uniref:SET domain-containing protein n=1 Tax=Rehmannia glutinosa TaxID=99300 RepID=A0ABR0U063_REHGL